MIIKIHGLHQCQAKKLKKKFDKNGWSWNIESYSQVFLKKDCVSLKQAILEYEKISKYSILDTDQDGCVLTFFEYTDSLLRQQKCVSGWEALKFVYPIWFSTPRKCLEELNFKDEKHHPKNKNERKRQVKKN